MLRAVTSAVNRPEMLDEVVTRPEGIAQARVLTGSKYLDAHFPNWPRRMNLKRLSVASSYWCPLAMAAGGNFIAVLASVPFTIEDVIDHGFTADTIVDFPTLNAAWSTHIVERLILGGGGR